MSSFPMTNINPILELISGPLAFFIGVFSGVTAHFIGRWIWMWYKRPELDFFSTKPAFESDDNGNLISRVFLIQVKNKGRQAAKNCKPEFMLEGELNENKYVIQGNVRWEEGQNPSRITINQDESVSFPLFKLITERTVNIVQSAPEFKIQFPSNEGWGNSANILKWHVDSDGQIEDAEFLRTITLEDFHRIGWQNREVRVTSENASKIVEEFQITSDSTAEMGLTGMQLEWS